MLKFNVADMTCGHCVSVITKAILQLQDDAKVEADIANRTIAVSSDLTADEIQEAIKAAGYQASDIKTSCCNPQHSCHA